MHITPRGLIVGLPEIGTASLGAKLSRELVSQIRQLCFFR